MPIYRIVLLKSLDLDSKKVAQGGEYQKFLLNKKLFIHFFFLVLIQL